MISRPGILITGGAKRIGAHLARYFVQHGYDIVLHYNQSGTEAAALKAELETLGAKVVLIAHDLANIAGIPAFMDKVKSALPNCAVLVNNASVFERASFMQTSEALFDRQLNVNFKAPFFLTQAFVRSFEKGVVINILDTDISKTQVSHFAYLQSKKALAEFTKMAARELGPDIRVNGVCPGCILPSNQNDVSYEEKMAAIIPLKSHPFPQEVAQSAFWLVSQPHITGQLIFIDGGKHAL